MSDARAESGREPLALWARAAAGVGLFALALAVRAAWWRGVFTANGLHTPHGADEYYHLRRIWYAVVNFPDILQRDPYVRFPLDGDVAWPPVFDLVVAFLARLTVGAEDQAAFDVFAAWVPPVLGAFTVVAAAWIGWRVFSPGVGLLSGVLLALLPVHYHFSQLGVIDHHVAVSLATTLLVAGAVAVVQGPASRPWPLAALALGLGSALFLLTWAGALLHLAVLQAAAAVWMLQARDAPTAISRARHLALAFGSCAVTVAPYTLGREWDHFDSWSLLALGDFHPVWFAATGAACLGLSVLWATTRLGAAPAARWLSAAGLALPVVVGALVVFPELRGSLDHAAGWFTEDEDFNRFIAENRPLFSLHVDGSPVALAEMQFTRFLYAFPLALVWLGYGALRDRRSDRMLLAVWGGAFFALTLLQSRFENTFSVPYAIIGAGALARLSGTVRRRLAGASPGRRVAAVVVVASLAGWVVFPSASFLAGRVASGWRGALSVAPPSYVVARTHHALARWLGAHSPVTSGYLDTTKRPEYGVLVRWDMGHLFRYFAERPMLQDNFGVYTGSREFAAAENYYATESEREATGILDEFGVRYVVVDAAGSGHGGGYSPRSMARRLFPIDGATDLPGLRRHRLLVETDPNRIDAVHVMIYEHVAGAEVRGMAAPGAVVAAELEIHSDARPVLSRYRMEALADDDGSYRMRVAYPTGASRPVRTAGGYTIHCGGPVEEIGVPEVAVQEGRTVRGPSLTCVGGG